MSLSTQQQFQELLKKSSSPLILLPAYASRDALASAFALSHFLKALGKDVTVACENASEALSALAFLETPVEVLSSITGARDFVLSFNMERNKIVGVRTEKTESELRIYLTPDHGAIDPRDFSFIPARFKFDLAIVVGASDKEALGSIYEDNPDIFYEMPVVNIDNHSENELFGQVNLVELTASSLAEIIADALMKADFGAFDEPMAGYLLTGIISATESFQKKNTTPKALQAASHLMDKGADQQKIVRSLYKVQPLNLLKLWGRVMAQVKWNEGLRLIWALVSIEDLVQSRAKAEDLPAVLEKIRSSYSSAGAFMVLYPEDASHVQGLIKTSAPETLPILQKLLAGSRLHGETLRFSITAVSLEEAERQVIAALKPAA